MTGRIKITETEAAQWLEGYKTAWETRDVDLAVSLFTDDADYREKRFSEPLLGHKTLRSYWQDRVFEHQRDISFHYDIWAVKGNQCFAGWQASFTWLPINGIIEIDGVCRLTFGAREDARLLCSVFEEWMDHHEIR